MGKGIGNAVIIAEGHIYCHMYILNDMFLMSDFLRNLYKVWECLLNAPTRNVVKITVNTQATRCHMTGSVELR